VNGLSTELPTNAATKLTPPEPPAVLLSRQRLLERLTEGLSHPLLLLCAEAGYGKSILLTQFVRSLDWPVAWYTLDGEDRAPQVFLRYLAIALQPYLPAASLIAEEPTITSLLHALSALPGPLLLVLDDYQHLIGSTVASLLNQVLSHRQPCFHLAAASRRLPEWDVLPRLQAQGEALVLTAADLCFTSQEAQALFATIYGLDLTPAQVRALMARTEGWPIALQLVAQAARRLGDLEEALRHVEQSAAPLPAYLAGEVLHTQPPLLQTFLRDTSILTHLTPSLCDHLLQSTDAARHLEHLHHQGLFLYREGTGPSPVYRYHPLFAGFLQGRLREDPVRWRTLHRRAAGYLEKQDSLERAVEHWLAAGEFSRAAPLVARLARPMWESSRFDRWQEWTIRLPTAELDRHPDILLSLGQAQIDYSQLDEALTTLSQAERVCRRQGDMAGLSRALRHKGTVYWRLGEHQQASDCFTEALQCLPADRRRDRAALLNTLALVQADADLMAARQSFQEARQIMAEEGDKFGLATVLTNLAGYVLLRQGEFPAALRALEKATCLFEELDNRHYLGYCLTNTATLLVLMGQYDRARELARQTLRISQELELLNVEGRALDTLGSIWQAARPPDLEEARRCCQEALDIALRTENQGAEVDACLGLSLVHRRRGELVEAERHSAQALLLSRESGNRWDVARSLREAALTDLATGRVERARERLAENRRIFSFYQARYDLVAVDLWTAVLALQEGNETAAMPPLAAGLRVARQQAYDALFLHERDAALPLLALALRRGMETDYVAHLLRRIGAEATPHLLPLLNVPDEAVRRRVLALLGEIGDRGALAALEALVEREKRSPLAPLVRETIARIAARPPAPLRVYMLGRFAVHRGEQAITAWGSRKAEQMFEYLVAWREQPVPREVRVELLGPGAKPEAGEKSFYMALRQVRQALDPHLSRVTLEAYIISEEGAYGFNPQAEIWVDTGEFEGLYREGRRAEQAGHLETAMRAYQSAVTLYRGDFLGDDLYLDWPIARRERLRNHYLETLGWLGEYHFRRGEYRRSVEYARLILERDNCREDAQRLLMRCYARLGQRNRALRQYEQCRETIQRELALEPTPETTALYQRIRAGEKT